MSVTFTDALKLEFLDGIPGNAAAYVKLHEEIEDVSTWEYEIWFNLRLAYYCGAILQPTSAWLHDMYKNRCLYDVQALYKALLELRNF